MNRFASRHPIIFSILAVLLAVILIKLLDVGMSYLNLPELAHRLVVEAVFCGYVGFLLSSLGWWRQAGFKAPTPWRKLVACLPLLFLPVVVVVSNGFKPASASQVILFALVTVMVAFDRIDLPINWAIKFGKSTYIVEQVIVSFGKFIHPRREQSNSFCTGVLPKDFLSQEDGALTFRGRCAIGRW